MANDFITALVIDNGSGFMKAGMAGGQEPGVIFPTYVGRTKHLRAMADAPTDGIYVGEQAEQRRGILRLNYPCEHGIVNDWRDMQKVWEHVFKKVAVTKEDHPVLLTEAPLNPRSNRGRAAEIFFETFQVPAFYVQIQAILSLYASGRTTGVVLDVGDGVAHALPVYEGFMLPHAIERSDVAGRDVTRYLQLLLRKSGYNFHTSAEFEVVKDIKEKVCYVAFNIEKSEKEEEAEEELDNEAPYRLPDGQVINVGPEKFRAPEILFNPSLIGLEYVGIHQLLVNSISKADLDIRRTLYSEIHLAGGSTMFTGLGERLLSEVRKLAPRDTKIRIMAPKNRMLSAWIGGSILASLRNFQDMWVTRAQYDEYGKSIIYRQTL